MDTLQTVETTWCAFRGEISSGKLALKSGATTKVDLIKVDACARPDEQ